MFKCLKCFHRFTVPVWHEKGEHDDPNDLTKVTGYKSVDCCPDCGSEDIEGGY